MSREKFIPRQYWSYKVLFLDGGKPFRNVNDGAGTGIGSGISRVKTKKSSDRDFWRFTISHESHKLGPAGSVRVGITHRQGIPPADLPLKFDGKVIELGPRQFCQFDSFRIIHADRPQDAIKEVRLK